MLGFLWKRIWGLWIGCGYPQKANMRGSESQEKDYSEKSISWCNENLICNKPDCLLPHSPWMCCTSIGWHPYELITGCEKNVMATISTATVERDYVTSRVTYIPIRAATSYPVWVLHRTACDILGNQILGLEFHTYTTSSELREVTQWVLKIKYHSFRCTNL